MRLTIIELSLNFLIILVSTKLMLKSHVVSYDWHKICSIMEIVALKFEEFLITPFKLTHDYTKVMEVVTNKNSGTQINCFRIPFLSFIVRIHNFRVFLCNILYFFLN